MKENRIEIDKDFLIIAPNPDGSGYVYMLSERAWLVDNLDAFRQNNPMVSRHSIAIYELREINKKQEQP